MTKLYLAYGSNLDKGQMSYRCPKAKPVGSAMIYGWQLEFRGVATIVKTNNTVALPVGIWEITEDCEHALDAYEACSPDNNGLYRKEKVAGIMTYIMNRGAISPPSTGYFNTILRGYNDFGLDTTHLYDAAGWSNWEQRTGDRYAEYA